MSSINRTSTLRYLERNSSVLFLAIDEMKSLANRSDVTYKQFMLCALQ